MDDFVIPFQSVQSVASVSGVSTAKVLVEGGEPKYQVEIEGASNKCVAPREVLYHIFKYMHGKREQKGSNYT